jgi:hypothetical protein
MNSLWAPSVRYAVLAGFFLTSALAGCRCGASGKKDALSGGTSGRLHPADFGQGLPHSGQWRNGFALADLNGDGQLDLVHGPPRKSAPLLPVILLGDGKGTFHPWTEARFPPLPFDYGDIAVADLNSDGHPDLALGMHLRGLAALTGDGHGGFTPWNEGLPLTGAAGAPGVPPFSSRAIALADWNGDQALDLIALSDGPGTPGAAASAGLRIYVNSAGKWQPLASPSSGDQLFGDSLAVGDVNADGHADVLHASNVMGSTDVLKLGNPTGWSSAPLPGLEANALIRGVTLADFDHDGRADPVVAFTSRVDGAWQTGIDLFLSRPDGFEKHRILVEPGRRESYALTASDFDHDGALDLAASRTDGSVQLFVGDKAGRLVKDAELTAPAWRSGCAGYHLQAADLNGDGRPELVASFAGESDALAASAECSNGGGLQAWTFTP